jgi:hypothetical protein
VSLNKQILKGGLKAERLDLWEVIGDLRGNNGITGSVAFKSMCMQTPDSAQSWDATIRFGSFLFRICGNSRFMLLQALALAAPLTLFLFFCFEFIVACNSAYNLLVLDLVALQHGTCRGLSPIK